MKFLKNTVAIVALLAIGSVSAKQMKKIQSTAQPIAQPAVTEQDIRNYIDEIFNENYDELSDMLLKNYDQYEKQDICNFIKDLTGFIADKFPMHKSLGKRLFKDEMMGFCDSVKNDTARINFIQQCIDNSMMKPSPKDRRQMRRTERMNKKNMNK